MIFGVGRRLLRVQCKWALHAKGVVLVRLYSSRRSRDGFTRRLYTPDEIDAVAAYCDELNTIYYLPFDRFGGRAQVMLRIAPTANNQQSGVNWARDYELERLDWAPLGAVAQLGERRHGMAEVTGSIPVGSIF